MHKVIEFDDEVEEDDAVVIEFDDEIIYDDEPIDDEPIDDEPADDEPVDDVPISEETGEPGIGIIVDVGGNENIVDG